MSEIRRPQRTGRREQAEQATDELKLPDNPKVIQRLLRMIEGGKDVERIAEIYKAAAERRESSWYKVTRLLDEAIIKALPDYLRIPSLREHGLQLWDVLSRTTQSELETVTMEYLTEPYFEAAPEPTPHFSVDNFLARRQVMERCRADLEQLLRTRYYLLIRFDRYLTNVIGRQFTKAERFLLDKPRAAIEKLGTFPTERQEEIITHWQQHPHIDWPAILTDPAAIDLAEIVLAFPSVQYYAASDRNTILRIANEFTPTQRAAALEKAKPTDEPYWDDVYVYVAIGHLPQATVEQIKTLSHDQIKKIKAFLFAWGREKLAELWTEDNVADFVEFDTNSWEWKRYPIFSNQLSFFAKNLSPTLRRHLALEGGGGFGSPSATRPDKTIFNNKGFQGALRQLDNFSLAVELIPESKHEAVFAVLKPQSYYYSLDERPQPRLTEDQADNFLDYVQNTQQQGEIKLNDLVDVAEYFLPGRYSNTQRGVEACQTLGLVLPPDDEYNRTRRNIEVYEQAGLPEHEPINQFLYHCQQRSTSYVIKERGNNYSFITRSLDSMMAFYQLADTLKANFSSDSDEMAQFLNLDETAQHLIRQWQSGELLAGAANFYDLPVIEGAMHAIDRNLPNKIQEDKQTQLTTFQALTTPQKRRWLYLRKNMRWQGGEATMFEQLCNLATTEHGERLEAFLRVSALTNFTTEAAEVMANHPDYLGVWYYLDAENIYQSEDQLAAVNYLLELARAGLPKIYWLTAPNPKLGIGSKTDSFGAGDKLKQLMEWPPARLVNFAQLAERECPAFSLIDLINVSPEYSDDWIRRSLKQTALEQKTFIHCYHEPPTDDALEANAQRVATAERLLAEACDTNQRQKLFSLTALVWEYFSTRPTILRNFLTGNIDHVPKVAIKLPDDLLASAITWSVDLPASFFENETVMRSFHAIHQQLAAVDLKLPRNINLQALIEAKQQATWLFEPDNLAWFKHESLSHLPAYANFTETEWLESWPNRAHFQFEQSIEVAEYLERWRNRDPILPEDELFELNDVVSAVPWNDAKTIATERSSGDTLAEAVADLDTNKSEYEDWYKLRCAKYYEKVRPFLPTFGLDLHCSLAQWQEMVALPEPVLRRIERLSPHKEKIFWRDTEKLTNFIAVAKHPNFEMVVSLVESNEYFVSRLFSSLEAEVQQFCDQLTAVQVERLKNWPKKILVPNLRDVSAVLAHPKLDELLEFANVLTPLVGADFYINVYNLLLFDPPIDRANIATLQAGCYFPVTTEQLQPLARIADGSMNTTITRLLALTYPHQHLDFAAITPQLRALAPTLQVAYFMENGATRFGWDLLPRRASLLTEFGISAKQFDALLCAVYKAHGERGMPPSIDYDVARALLTEEPSPNEEEQRSRWLAVITHYNADYAPIIQLLAQQPKVATLLTKGYWDKIPKVIKQQPIFWELLYNHDRLTLLDHYVERHPTVTLSAADITLIEQDHNVSSGYFYKILFFADKGELTLSPSQRDDIMIAYIRQGGSIDDLLKQPQFRRLVQDQIAAVAAGWPKQADEPDILPALTNAGIIAEPTVAAPRTVTAQVELELITAMFNLQPGGLAALDRQVEAKLGERLYQLSRTRQSGITGVVRLIVGGEFQRLGKETETNAPANITEVNWLPWLMAFVRTTIDDHQLPSLQANVAQQAAELFKRTDVKDFCLQQLHRLWDDYLQSDTDQWPVRLTVLTEFVDDCQGAGPLSQIEALSKYIHQVRRSLASLPSTSRTADEISGGVRQMAERFTRDGWSNDDRADFYNISRDVLQAAPSLFTNFTQVFENLQPAQLRRFVDEIYPLYRAQLAILGRPGETEDSPPAYQVRDLVRVRQSLREFNQVVVTAKEISGKGASARQAEAFATAFTGLRQRLIGEVATKFKDRFGITKIPAEFTPEHIRSLVNVTVYLANMHNRTKTKERVLGWFLALMMNGQWEAFRRGEELKPDDYVIPAHAAELTGILSKQRELNPLTAERLKVAEADLPEWQRILQRESTNVAIGDVETIDVKLGNIMVNMETLLDLDLYPDPMDKARMELLLKYGNRPVSAVAAKWYQMLTHPERDVQFTAEEQPIQEQLQHLLETRRSDITPASIKTHLQDGLKGLALIVNVAKFMEETGVKTEIDKLRIMLLPSDEVIAIFRRLGEDFQPTSGAMALTQDLAYLRDLIVKREDELLTNERSILDEYINLIQAQVVKLQAAYDQVKTKFNNLRTAHAASSNTLLRAKFGQIDQIINTQTSEQSVTTTMTSNLNAIMENIRECLSCRNQGFNNDTDLTFGENNKFFIYSHTEQQRRGSVADQVVFLEPVKDTTGNSGLALVMDQVYGTCTPFILTNHIVTAFKTVRNIKERFPDCPLGVFVTSAALRTGAASADQLIPALTKALGKKVHVENTTLEVDVAKSALGDHYIEFGGGNARAAGKRTVTGLMISLAA